jgi:hypothetical protein
MPKDEAWDGDMRGAAEALEAARRECDLDPEDAHHRQGDYLNLRTGVSIGGGQKRPTVALNSDRNNEILDRLNSMECFKKLSKFSTCKPRYSFSNLTWLSSFDQLLLNHGRRNCTDVMPQIWQL